ncbi:valine--tRNA ligase [Hwanghaeella grinnelliae]|uniref:Valine--tRNA ligase n=1 Tax=Hwanghaeella grinnelliae TaxID=2500179 RepID=A0A437QX14_9PROT|nr:valine--tRNA ligase [Hwanghaeella grinnelliae]RVU38983.1 valine--tRNA ligase [Hwanghaeella grinnelliae]
MLEKTYTPETVEDRRYREWEEGGFFKCGQNAERNSSDETFTIVIPPPNVTGSLHMGHALNNTLQDIMIRYQRMRGLDVLWQPGTDHAGIATQMVVERQLAQNGEPNRRDMGREAFLERVWKWKEESGGTITGQLRRLGASCDWSRERFTMDEGLSRAVLKVFVQLYKENLIYRDKRLVNWDPALETAISDLEVQQQEIQSNLWYFRYPVEGEDGTYLTVATTRPETMLGDSGVAVHPDDERYKHLIGKHCILPLVGRRIPIVADAYADPEQGSGAVKMTPAHDFNDFEVGVRHNLEMINIFTTTAHINENAPEKYRGMDRFEARKAIVEDIEALGLLEKIDDHTHMVPYGDRGGVPIEPYLTDQWFADAKTLAKPAIESVEQGRTKFVPENWTKTYYEWMRNIQPWCISRQLWWGHQIPAWYGPDGEVFVEETEELAYAEALAHYKDKGDVQSVEMLEEGRGLERDPDVLDTWFSSALWPFSTLGWPDETPEVARYYPTSVLVTGFDIIFFWVARMMMMGLHFMKEEPFHTVYVHALVRDEKGAKMSKSKGNVIDPLDLIDQYGADSLRFTLTAQAAQGRDVKLATSRVEGYRNFMTKLWNAARFCEMNECLPVDGFDPAAVGQTVNKWIVGETVKAERAVRAGIESYRFNDAASSAYQFVWNVFCDWYLEFAKPLLTGDDAAAQVETRATAAWVLEQILKLMHPMTPFITEELYDHLKGENRSKPLIVSDWPVYDDGLIDAAADADMNWVIKLISEIRSARSEANVPPAAKMDAILVEGGDAVLSRAKAYMDLLGRMARIDGISIGEAPKGALQVVVDEAVVALPLAGVIDLDAEKARLEKAIAKADGEITKIDKKLSNQGFLAKAPDEVVQENRDRLAEEKAARDKLANALERISAAL